MFKKLNPDTYFKGFQDTSWLTLRWHMFWERIWIFFNVGWTNEIFRRIPKRRNSFHYVPCWNWELLYFSGSSFLSNCINLTGWNRSFERRILMRKDIIKLLEEHPGYRFTQRELLNRLNVRSEKRKNSDIFLPVINRPAMIDPVIKIPCKVSCMLLSLNLKQLKDVS